MAETEKALSGYRIIDLTQVESGPTGTQVLAWMGADVIKVEPPGHGDMSRSAAADDPDLDSPYFLAINSNKRSITLDLKTEKGVEVLLKDAPDLQHSHFPTSHVQIRQLLDRGVQICVCPGCLKAAGKTPDDVMEGVQIADKDRFFDFTQGRILSLDY